MPQEGITDAAVGDLRSNLTAARECRKRSELDAQLLANRIALLKQEEEKAWKKIEETRKRAGEIVSLRTQNERKFQEKEEFYKMKWESINRAQAQNAYMRDKGRQMRDNTKAAMVEGKKNIVRNQKNISQENLLQKKEREAHERQANSERTLYIKQQKDEAQRRAEDD